MTVKLGFIGTGGIANHHIRSLAQIEGVSLTAFYDVDLGRAQKAASEHNDAKAYAKLNDMLDDNKLDGVYICVPPLAHGDAERQLIERAIPFLVEKPIGINRDTPAAISQAIKDKNLITSVGYHWRYSETAQIAKKLLAERTPGMALGYWMGGMPMVPWWRVMTGSGGQFVEQTTHIVDMLRFLCGEVNEVYAAYALQAMGKKVEGTDVPDVGTVTMKLANGMVATISNTCMMPVGHHVGLDIYTDEGVLEVRDTSLKVIETEGVQTHSNGIDLTIAEDEAFIHAIRTGDTSRIKSNYEDALRTHEITIAASESAVSGKPVLLGSY
ncbi:Gfo/Idh/MocA family protein [Paenibacillus sp. NAIST15-1]|uniref:Gfo/Idh/MocA family protein n=1 Tax=Paenibacillus sp. NAIST15-1 TaxID=1605994 RepID=UPI0008693CE8|nr:Gfo/Idh/MocA family oxidoreductase [Paenibacillus sp. NAIST15-1]GAV14858.1 oxidoreductase domain protein [Paenibacillus sp. NAIST15-1]